MLCVKSLAENVTFPTFEELYSTILVSLWVPSFSLRVIFSTLVAMVYDADVKPGGVESVLYDIAADRCAVLALFQMSVMPPGCIATFRG